MAIQLVDVPPLDPNIYTGPTRVMSGIARMGDIVTDQYYNTASPEFARWLYVGVSGNVSIVKWDGTTQVLVGLGAGIWHPIYSIKINSSGTTATNLVWGS